MDQDPARARAGLRGRAATALRPLDGALSLALSISCSLPPFRRERSPLSERLPLSLELPPSPSLSLARSLSLSARTIPSLNDSLSLSLARCAGAHRPLRVHPAGRLAQALRSGLSTHYTLRTTHYTLHTTRHTPHTTHYTLHTAHRTTHTTHHSPLQG